MDDDVLCAMRALEERVTELERRVSAQEDPDLVLDDSEDRVEAVFDESLVELIFDPDFGD